MEENSVHAHLAEASLGCQNFVTDIPNFAGPSIYVHGPALSGNDPANAQFVETAKDSPAYSANSSPTP